MPVQLSVGLPVLTINHGSTFMVTDLNGEIAAHSEQGIFAEDTRFVSYYALTANGQPWVRLTSAATNYYSSLVYLTNPELATEEGIVTAGTVVLTLARGAGEGIHEDLDLVNHGLTPVRFNLEITLRSDFADLFEVKDHRFVRRGRIVSEWDPDLQQLRTSYRNGE